MTNIWQMNLTSKLSVFSSFYISADLHEWDKSSSQNCLRLHLIMLASKSYPVYIPDIIIIWRRAVDNIQHETRLQCIPVFTRVPPSCREMELSTMNFDMIKELPGYRAILKAVLKMQIQQLVSMKKLASSTWQNVIAKVVKSLDWVLYCSFIWFSAWSQLETTCCWVCLFECGYETKNEVLNILTCP